jgi:Icc-related predicted phosphoesterase
MPSVAGESIFIHAGDATVFSRSSAAITDFNAWLGELPYTHRIYVPGNHDSFISMDPSKRSPLSNATVLVNGSVDIAGLRIWGSPVTPLANTAFGLPSAADRRRLYSTIPDDTDVLISHGPPSGILDLVPGSNYHSGCPELLEAVQRVQPMLHVFGHVHGAHGTEEIDDTLYVNAGLLGPGGGIEEKQVVIRFTSRVSS